MDAIDAEGNTFIFDSIYLSSSGHLVRVLRQPYDSASVVDGREITIRRGRFHDTKKQSHWHGDTLLPIAESVALRLTSRRDRQWEYGRLFRAGPAGERVRAQVAERRALIAGARKHGTPKERRQR